MPADAGKGGPKHSEYGHIFQCARLNENKCDFFIAVHKHEHLLFANIEKKSFLRVNNRYSC